LGKKSKHIAVIRLSAMGDVAMTIPVLLALIQQHPEVKITVVSRPFFKPLFQQIPGVQFLSVHTNHKHKGLLGIFRLYRDLKALGVDAIADLHNVLRSKMLRFLFLIQGKKTAFTDKGRQEKKQLTRLKHKSIAPLKPMTLRHVDTFEKLGFPINFSANYFLPKHNLSQSMLEITPTKSKPWIGIAPFAHHSSKTYSEDLMQHVVAGLANLEVQVFLFGGGRHEAAILEKMTLLCANCINMANKVSFEHELELISNLDLMLSMDSGNAHLAALYGVNTITLWGATHPYAGFAPYGQLDSNCLTADREQYPFLPTSVYGNREVSGYENAMRTITPEQILQKIKTQLGEHFGN
jgi:ADP-heptose:LPS heptosyltransferase